ncbi:hypothetical protein EAY64_05480 [Aquitalea palustris]|uniref:Uncharacterized protein n=1 Tax=Aquitalea palustris TaxID=2480983 RepID=A0A454JKY2_9NEIS|nr:hypothetical protein [Aquitalea palustris]RMD00048.1 hypothetical protein EAY64_05480 [Aquitalea palustris]
MRKIANFLSSAMIILSIGVLINSVDGEVHYFEAARFAGELLGSALIALPAFLYFFAQEKENIQIGHWASAVNMLAWVVCAVSAIFIVTNQAMPAVPLVILAGFSCWLNQRALKSKYGDVHLVRLIKDFCLPNSPERKILLIITVPLFAIGAIKHHVEYDLGLASLVFMVAAATTLFFALTPVIDWVKKPNK